MALERGALLDRVILPALPNPEMGYLGVLNPFAIWLMVVLIVGISLAAYLAGKFLGGMKGAAMAGIFGGLISSTATTASLARRSCVTGACGISLAAITLIASAIVFVRVMVEVIIAAPNHVTELLPPLLTMMFWFGLVAAIMHRISEKKGQHRADEQPPSELKSAVVFGLLYAVVLLAVAAALSGLTDMDAITLSTSRLVSTANLETATAWRMILLGGLANIVFKMILVAVLGARAFVKPALVGLGSALVGGGAILLLWP